MKTFFRSPYFLEFGAVAVTIILPFIAGYLDQKVYLPSNAIVIAIFALLVIRSSRIYFSQHYPESTEKLTALITGISFFVLAFFLTPLNSTLPLEQIRRVLWAVWEYHLFVWVILQNRREKKKKATALPHSPVIN